MNTTNSTTLDCASGTSALSIGKLISQICASDSPSLIFIEPRAELPSDVSAYGIRPEFHGIWSETPPDSILDLPLAEARLSWPHGQIQMRYDSGEHTRWLVLEEPGSKPLPKPDSITTTQTHQLDQLLRNDQAYSLKTGKDLDRFLSHSADRHRVGNTLQCRSYLKDGQLKASWFFAIDTLGEA